MNIINKIIIVITEKTKGEINDIEIYFIINK